MEMVKTDDPFRVAFLLGCGGQGFDARLVEGRVVYRVRHRDIRLWDLAYRTGKARINPLCYREVLMMVLETGRDLLVREKGQRIEVIDVGIDPEVFDIDGLVEEPICMYGLPFTYRRLPDSS